MEENLFVVFDGMARSGAAPVKHFVQAFQLLSTQDGSPEYPVDDIVKKLEEAGYRLFVSTGVLYSNFSFRETFDKPLLEKLLKK